MAKQRRGSHEDDEEDVEKEVQAKSAPAPDAPDAPKSSGDLTQEEIDEKIIKQVKEAVVCVTGSDPTVKLTPEQATRLLTLAGHPLGEE